MNLLTERGLRSGNELDVKMNLEAVFGSYILAADAFAHSLRQSSSEYELMVAKQRYLLSAASLLKGTSEIFGYHNIYPAASFFEAAAWAYLDKCDHLAYSQALDNRFVLNKESSQFLRSRLRTIAERINRIQGLYATELRDAMSLDIPTLRFLLELVLELPMGAWECAPCLAVSGKCKDCGYGQDHGICSQSGSTYEMLGSSREAILKSIRKNLAERERRYNTENLTPEQHLNFDCSDKLLFAQMDIDICGEYDLAEICD